MIADEAPDQSPTSLRQWACFPRLTSECKAAAASQTFRLLVESAGGRLAIVTVALRTLPDAVLAANLATLIDEREFALVSHERQCGEFDARHGVTLELLDVDLDQDDPLKITAAIPRALARRVAERGGSSSPVGSLSELRASVTEGLVQEWRDLRFNFVAGLNLEAVEHARGSGGLTPSAYSYLGTVGQTQRRNRTQALAAFPLLRPMLAKPAFDAVRQAIDDGRPLIDCLAVQLQAPKGMVRVLRGVVPSDIGHLAGDLGVVVRLLREIPADWWPRDTATWRQFAQVTEIIARITHRSVTTSSNQLWLRQSAREGYRLSNTVPEDLVQVGEDIDEFMTMLRRALTWVQSLPRDPGDVAPRKTPMDIAAEVRVGLGLDKLAQVARRFGDAYRRAVSDFADEAELWKGVRWPAVGNGEFVRGDLVIQPLVTPASLREEGTRMHNCVAGYIEECMKGKCQIWSVRNSDGSLLATLETRIRSYQNGRRTLLVHQLKGIANGAPPAHATRAVHGMIDAIDDNPETMDAYLAWKQTISRQPLAARQRHALMQPIVIALQKTLHGRWAWHHLIETTKDVR